MPIKLIVSIDRETTNEFIDLKFNKFELFKVNVKFNCLNSTLVILISILGEFSLALSHSLFQANLGFLCIHFRVWPLM